MRFHKLSTAISPEIYVKTREIIFGPSMSSVNMEVDPGMPKCVQHGKSLELFCKKCQEAVCSLCVMLGDHKEHECITISQASELFAGWISDLRKEVTELVPICKSVAEAYEDWSKRKESFRDEALKQVHETYANLMKCAEEHERTVCEHANTLYDSFEESSRMRKEGVHTIIGRTKELIETVGSGCRISAFAQELLERELKNNLLVLQSVLKSAPKEEAAILSVEDHRKLLVDMKIVSVSRSFRLNGCATSFPISIDDLISSRSAPSDLSVSGDTSAHDGGAVIDPERRLIISVSGNCNNGKDIFLLNIDKKETKRLRDAVPYGTHGQYPVFDGQRRVYFFESESRNNDRFGYFDLETQSFTTLKKCPSPFREFCSSCYMDGNIYSVCRDKTLWVYNIESDEWKRLGYRVGKVRLQADPETKSLVILKKRKKFWTYNVETKEETVLPLQPRLFNLGSNQEMLFLRRTSEDFILICSFDSHDMYAFISKDNKWVDLPWRDVRNGSAHTVFDPVTSAFYYKIDSESHWYTVKVKME